MNIPMDRFWDASLKAEIASLKSKLKDETALRVTSDAAHDASISAINGQLAQQTSLIKQWSEKKSEPTAESICVQAALNGDMIIREHADAADMEVSDAVLTAAAGTYETFLTAYLEDKLKRRHVWADHALLVTVTEFVASLGDATGFTIVERGLAVGPKWTKGTGRTRIGITWPDTAYESGTKSTGVLTLTGNALDTETVIIDGKTYTFQTALTDVDGNVLIGATADDSINNLIGAITLGGGTGTTYAALTTLHPTATAAAGAGDTMDVTAKVPGTAGDVATTETLLNGSWGGGTLTGGVDYDYIEVNIKSAADDTLNGRPVSPEKVKIIVIP